MEEIYIVKLKGLPPPTQTSHESLSKDNKTSFYYHTDLTAEAIRGFSYLHIFFGITVLCLSVTNLCFHENPLALDPPLGITVWCAVSFILLGLFGIVTAYQRRSDLSKSIAYVKVHFFIIIIVLSITLTFAILFVLDLHGPIANQFIGLNIVFSILVETVILLLTLFTCARILWPGCMNFCAKNWPMQPQLKRKVIVKTKVFTNGIQQNDSNMVQTFGPNCVISLNMPSPLDSQSPASSSISSSCSSPTRNALQTGTIGDYSSREEILPSLQTKKFIDDLASIKTNCAGNSSTEYGNNSCMPLQTFPNETKQQLDRTKTAPTLLSNGVHRLLYQHSQLFKNNSIIANSDNGPRLYNQHIASNEDQCVSDDIDPYDTDEFDYCSTEDEDMGSKDNIVLESYEMNSKTSSDDGRGTLDEDKSSTHSEMSQDQPNNYMSSGHSGSSSPENTKLYSEDLELNEQNNSTGHINGHPNESSVQIGEDDVNEVVVNQNPRETLTKFGRHVSQSILQELANGDEEDRDEGIASSGSSTCSREEVTRSLSSSPLHMSSFEIPLKPTYKSSIKIESNNSRPICKTVETVVVSNAPTSCDSATPPQSSPTINTATVSNGPTKQNTTLTSSEKKSPESVTTIRLLNTNKSARVFKQNKLRINLNTKETSSLQVKGVSVPSINNKLASHPYLCRLRASNFECFERRYPKLETSNTVSSPPSSPSSETSSSSSTSSTSVSLKRFTPSKHSKTYHESHRIPDIQRV